MDISNESETDCDGQKSDLHKDNENENEERRGNEIEIHDGSENENEGRKEKESVSETTLRRMSDQFKGEKIRTIRRKNRARDQVAELIRLRSKEIQRMETEIKKKEIRMSIIRSIMILERTTEQFCNLLQNALKTL